MEDRIPTNLRTLLILEVLGTSDRALSPTEINQSIGLPKQTIHRLCAKLEQEGFLAREEDGKKLRPTRRSRLMASGLLYASRFHIARHQVMQRVADEVGETVNFVVPDSEGMIYVDRVETDWPFRCNCLWAPMCRFTARPAVKPFWPAWRPRPVRRWCAVCISRN